MNIKLTSTQLELLKHLALSLMVVDHIAFLIGGWDHYLHVPGRLVFPILAIIIAYNYLYNSHDTKKYTQRLLIFALISQVTFVWFFDTEIYRVNIFFTLWAGIMLLRIKDGLITDNVFCKSVLIPVAIVFAAAGFLFQPYSIFGPLSVYVAGRYLKSENRSAGWLLLLFIVVFLLNYSMGWLMCIAGTVSLLVIYLVSRLHIQWPRVKGRWLYWFYPAHLVVLKTLSMAAKHVH